MLAISQKPERVSNILRSSTETTRPNGIGANAGRSGAGAEVATGAVVVLMRRLLRAGWWR